ncbi:MAG TPA: hypothetical protein V6C85_08170, partial [Allocoleopsis sp.]
MRSRMVSLCREDLIKDAPAPARPVRVQPYRFRSGVQRSQNGTLVSPELAFLGGFGAKPLLRKFVPLCVGMTCIGSTVMVLFQSSSAFATPGSENARAVIPNTLLAMAKVDTDSVSNTLFSPGMLLDSTLSPIESFSLAPRFARRAILNGQEAVEPSFLPNLSSEIYLQAQNSPVTPAPNPG